MWIETIVRVKVGEADQVCGRRRVGAARSVRVVQAAQAALREIKGLNNWFTDPQKLPNLR
jgi:hypothetical protein